MVDEQEFHHAFARLADDGRAGENFRRLAIRAGAKVVHTQRARSLRLRHALHFDKTHAAVASDGQPLMIAEPRHFRAHLLASLNDGGAIGDFDFNSVDFNLGHGVLLLRRNLANRTIRVGVGAVLVDAGFDDGAEMAD